MILEGIKTNVEGNVESHVCKIEANPVMYDILSNRLYKHKVRAVVRELSTNAVDSHKKSGNIDTPLKVQLPTILEPAFIIRDFGTGLVEQDIYDLYMTYGASDKRDSNLFNGALGVGSKSPFAYTQAFSVVSYFGGEATTYSVFSENGSPKIAKLGSVPSDEHTGLMIEVPVEDGDIHKFTEEASYVYQFLGFPVELNFEIDSLFDETDTDFKKDNWAIYPSMDESYIIMAGIGYSLQNLYVPNADILNTKGLVIKVETGDVQFAASREELSLSPDTIKKLQEIAVAIEKDFEEVAEKAIEGAEGLMAVVKVTNGMPNMFKTTIAKKYPLINNSYYGNMTINFPDDWKVTIKTSICKDTYNKVRILPAGFITSPENYTVILLDMVSWKSRIIQDHYYGQQNVMFINTTIRKTKENSKKRFEDNLKLLGITEYKWATDFDYAAKRRGSKGATSTPRTTVFENSWSYVKVTNTGTEYNTFSTIASLTGLDLDKVDIYPIAMYRDFAEFNVNKSGHTRSYYNFAHALATSLKHFKTLPVGKEIYIVDVPKARLSTMLKAGGKDWTELVDLKRKIVLHDHSAADDDLNRLGWTVGQYIQGTLEDLQYLPNDLKRELEIIKKSISSNKGFRDKSIKSALSMVTEAYQVVTGKPSKLVILPKDIKEGLEDKYTLVKQHWGVDKKKVCKMIDFSYRKMKELAV